MCLRKPTSPVVWPIYGNLSISTIELAVVDRGEACVDVSAIRRFPFSLARWW